MTATLPLTGERTAPGIWHENYWFARHEAAYRWQKAVESGDAVVVGVNRFTDAHPLKTPILKVDPSAVSGRRALAPVKRLDPFMSSTTARSIRDWR